MFSKATEYALRAMLYLAANSDEGKRLSLNEIAREIGSPVSFTAKVMQMLSRGDRLVHSVKGPGGGFYMTANSKKLPVLSVIEAMGEEHVLSGCVLGLPRCSDARPCPMHEEYKYIKSELLDMFCSRTIESLTEASEAKVIYLGKRKV